MATAFKRGSNRSRDARAVRRARDAPLLEYRSLHTHEAGTVWFTAEVAVGVAQVPFRITSLFKPDEYRPRQDAFLEPVVSAANRKMVKLVAYKPPGQDAGKEDWNLAVLVRRTRLSDQSTWLRAHDRKAALSEAARRRDTFKIFRTVSPHSHPASTGEHHSRGAVRHWSCGFTQTEQTVGAVIAADAALLADTRARHARVSITSSAKSCRGANDVRVAVVSDRRLRASAFRKSQEQSEQPENGVENLHR